MHEHCEEIVQRLKRLLNEAIQALDEKNYDFNGHRELAAWRRKNRNV
jgi:hypothetical protein